MKDMFDFPVKKIEDPSLEFAIELLNKILELSLVGICIYDNNGQCIFTNQSLANFIGGTKENILKLNYHTIESFKKSGIYDKIIIAITKQKIQEDIVSIHTTFNKQILLHYFFIPLTDNYLLQISYNLSQLETTQQKLMERETQFRLLFERNTDAIFWANPKTGTIIKCNKAAARLLECSEKEIIGMHQTELHPPDKIELYARYFREAVDRDNYYIDAEVVTNKGNIKYAECSSTFIQIDNEQIIQGVFRDKTEKIKMEQKLKETNAQLIQAEKLTALGGMTAGIAHEMSQPLNVIELISQKIIRKVSRNNLDNDNLLNELKNISSQVQKMATIVDQMRIYARKTDQIHKEKILVNDLINNSFIFMGEQLKIHNITVVKHLTDHEFSIYVDHIRIEQVLMNLIINARYAVELSKREDKQIEVGAYLNEGYTVIYVKDNGIGIPDHIHYKIFEPFFTTKEVGKGTGLGLHIAYKIVEEHKGQIEFSSKKDEGSEFRILLPIQ